jgi:hypothetical protein
MRIRGFGYALTIGAIAALLAGCGGSQPPVSAPGMMPQSRVATGRAGRGSWMLPEAKSADLLYAGDTQCCTTTGFGRVDVFSYPSGKLLGRLSGFDDPGGLCVDAAGDIWITNFENGNIVEYAHGGSEPIATLKANAYNPLGCSVDVTTGDLAVSYLGGAVAVWKSARGEPTLYRFSYGLSHCGYDDSGNLFVDRGSYFIGLLELPAGGKSFMTIALRKRIFGEAGQVQWDGQYITVEKTDRPGKILRIEVSGSTGKIVSETTFSGFSARVNTSWIQSGSLLIPYAESRKRITQQIGVWKYPAGGEPSRRIGFFKGSSRGVYAAEAVSLASSHSLQRQ